MFTANLGLVAFIAIKYVQKQQNSHVFVKMAEGNGLLYIILNSSVAIVCSIYTQSSTDIINKYNIIHYTAHTQLYELQIFEAMVYFNSHAHINTHTTERIKYIMSYIIYFLL